MKFMENREHFGALTDRMQAFREETLDQKPYVDAERAVLVTEDYKANLNQPPVMKRALGLKNILEKMTIYIENKTLVVGNQSTKKRDGDVFYITEETKQQLRDIEPFWKIIKKSSRKVCSVMKIASVTSKPNSASFSPILSTKIFFTRQF